MLRSKASCTNSRASSEMALLSGGYYSNAMCSVPICMKIRINRLLHCGLCQNYGVDSKGFHRGLELFNLTHFYDAHEVWEDVWRAAPAAEKKFLQGLIQIAVG